MKKKIPRIDIIVIGDEILAGKTHDANSHFLTHELLLSGFSTRSVSIVGDATEDIVGVLSHKIKMADVIIVTGGLGPTPDDITRFAVAQAVGKRLIVSPSQVKRIHKKLQGLSKDIKRLSEIEALLPAGSVPLDNTVGVAPGFRLKKNGCVIFCIPGVPREARDIFTRKIHPYMKKHFQKGEGVCAVIKTIGLRESEIMRRMKPYRFSGITFGIYPRGREVELRLRAPRNKKRTVEQAVRKINRLLLGFVYANTDTSIEEMVGKILVRKKMTLSCAESCTGGLIAKRITDIPGSSRYFIGSVIPYSNKLKGDLLGIKKDSIKKYGAVSSQVAREMVRGLIQRTETDIGISVTGIAGPGGGTRKKPVGLVFMGIYCTGEIQVLTFRFKGDREKIRWLTSQAAFHEMWRLTHSL